MDGSGRFCRFHFSMTCIAEIRLLSPKHNLAIEAVRPVAGIALLILYRGVNDTGDKPVLILRVALEAFLNRHLLLGFPGRGTGYR